MIRAAPLRRRCLLAVLLLSPLLASPARASSGEWDGYPLQVIDRPLSLPQGMAQATPGISLNLGSGSALQPSYPGVSVSYGATNDLTLSGALDLCVNGGGACAGAANDAGVLGTYTFDKSGPSAMAFTLGFNFTAFSPKIELAIPAGVLFRYTVAPGLFAVLVNPQFSIALTDRTTVQFDSFTAPFAFQLQATPHMMVQATLAFTLPVDQPEPLTADKTLFGAVGAGAIWSITNLLDVGCAFAFTNLLGKGPTQGPDGRTLNLFVAWRL